MHENRETSEMPTVKPDRLGRRGEGLGRTGPHAHLRGSRTAVQYL